MREQVIAGGTEDEGGLLAVSCGILVAETLCGEARFPSPRVPQRECIRGIQRRPKAAGRIHPGCQSPLRRRAPIRVTRRVVLSVVLSLFIFGCEALHNLPWCAFVSISVHVFIRGGWGLIRSQITFGRFRCLCGVASTWQE